MGNCERLAGIDVNVCRKHDKVAFLTAPINQFISIRKDKKAQQVVPLFFENKPKTVVRNKFNSSLRLVNMAKLTWVISWDLVNVNERDEKRENCLMCKRAATALMQKSSWQQFKVVANWPVFTQRQSPRQGVVTVPKIGFASKSHWN